ncbi:Phytanoyl-CoA dioxygenase [Arcticibacter svalbardensis MN12-7]|uniref:Phytanoyl-CoA dioxygenase n=1 Tax=Arcticibacter svalbardensis MN12-7 TaxID=1150600 RepID=R9GQ49_9SPHI|nr:phytanoyl-CoA dioxygenase family protein [Arcticibacter svalbardensis]EOR93846.1 Phytanoyl-CoA dioxygenase [Arcticibacter svalbardensis MN12-7]
MENKFDYSQSSVPSFMQSIDGFGWVIYENVLEPKFIDEINDSLEEAYEKRRQIQVNNGIHSNMEGTLHHLLEKDNFGSRFLEKMYFDEEMKAFLGGNYILNSFGGVMNSKNTKPYVQNIHRDVRSFWEKEKMMIQMMVLLDDFTLANGATYMLSGSHKTGEKPDEEKFYQHADRAVAKRGSIILFDSNLWHAAGKNTTEGNRRVLTLGFTRPYFKQQMDYPRSLGYEYGESLSDNLRQVIGYKSRIPENLYEFYQPLEKRMYQPGQG